MRLLLRKSGFSLMEVNLAVFIMAAGVLAMIGLYPLAYRENSQSVEDVKAAAYADAVFNQVAGVLSSRSLTWDEWEKCVKSAVEKTHADKEKNGAWVSYCRNVDSSRENAWEPKGRGEVNRLAQDVFSALTGGKGEWPNDSDYSCALVAQWGWFDYGVVRDDHSRVMLSMRVSRNAGALFAQPIFFTEIHFQGDQKEE